MPDKWIDINGYEGSYQVSNNGGVRSLPRFVKHGNKKILIKGKILTQQITYKGYLRVTVGSGKRKRTFQVHKLVANAFIPNIENKPQVNHKDGNKQNNSVRNLEWVTSTENMRHAKEHSLRPDFSTFDWGSPKVRVSKCDVKTGEVIETYLSVTRAAYANNLCRANIMAVLAGRRKKCGGYLWIKA